MSLVGVIGVGHLIHHLTPGLMRAKSPPKLLLSPRKLGTAVALAERFGCEVASGNEEIVARCQTVLLAVRPTQVVEALRGLSWRAGQTVVSLCAGVTIAAMEPLAAPARVIRAMPVTSAEFGESPTCLFPADADVAALLEPAGPVITLAGEAQFESASVIACYYGWVQALIGEMTRWLIEQGIDPTAARRLTAAMTRAGATMVLERPQTPIDSLVQELCLPGSFTGQGLAVLRGRAAFEPWPEAADALLARMRNA